MIIARFDARSRARVGDVAEMDVDVERLQFFDPDTGDRIAGEVPTAPATAQPAPESEPA